MNSVDKYILGFPDGIRQILVQVRKTILKNAMGKGSVQFPLDQPIPYELIAQMVAFRAMENKEKNRKK